MIYRSRWGYNVCLVCSFWCCCGRVLFVTTPILSAFFASPRPFSLRPSRWDEKKERNQIVVYTEVECFGPRRLSSLLCDRRCHTMRIIKFYKKQISNTWIGLMAGGKKLLNIHSPTARRALLLRRDSLSRGFFPVFFCILKWVLIVSSILGNEMISRFLTHEKSS